MKRTLALVWLIVMALLLPLAGVAAAQEKAQSKGWVAAQILFEKNCSKCHGNANSQVRAPARETLMKLSPEAIYAALTSGPMSVQAKDLTDEQKRLIAQHLGGRPFGVPGAGDVPEPGSIGLAASFLTPSAVTLRRALREKTWKPPESVRMARGQLMKRCRPPMRRMGSWPGRR